MVLNTIAGIGEDYESFVQTVTSQGDDVSFMDLKSMSSDMKN